MRGFAARLAAAAAVSSAPNPPVVSVLLPTTSAWPYVEGALRAALEQPGAPPYEVLLLDGHGAALAGEPAPPVRWLRHPGADAFALRAAGVAAARGEVVAISEDHCFAPPDWVAAIAAAHAADPRPVLVGATENHPASAASALDRANFLLTFAGQNPARLQVGEGRLPVPTNVSFKRAALGEALRPGELEYPWLGAMRARGGIGLAPQVKLAHLQSWGAAAPGIHFASGRSYGAAVRDWPTRKRLRWWRHLPALPLHLLRLVGPDLAAGAAGAAPGVADRLSLLLLVAANVAGQVAGALLGPGGSRARL